MTVEEVKLIMIILNNIDAIIKNIDTITKINNKQNDINDKFIKRIENLEAKW